MLNEVVKRAFVITLRESTRWPDTAAHLTTAGVTAEPFLGINATASGLVTTHTYEIDHPNSNYRVLGKYVGMHLSHLMVWQVCHYLATTPNDVFMVLEEDARFVDNWQPAFTSVWDCLNKVQPNWDMLLIGSCNCRDKPRQYLGSTLWKVEYPQCTHAYLVRAKALPLLLDKMQKVWAPVDLALVYGAYPHLNINVVLPRLVNQHNTVIHE